MITYKQFKTALSIVKELKHYNIEVIDKQIYEDEIVLNNYHKRIEEINKLDIEIDTYNKELTLLNTNDDYKYNPDCCICCSRTWVSRIKELEIIIDCLTNKSSKYYDINDENNYKVVSERFEENKKKQTNYHLLNEWYCYFKFKEAYDKITNDMNSIINTKEALNEELINKTLELTSITDYIEYFILYSFQLFDEVNNIRLFDNYSSWENNYDETNALIDKLEKSIHYNLVIKPRITKYTALKKEYEEWLLYDKNKQIIDAYHYYKLKRLVEMNDLYNEYQSNAQMIPLIKQKICLNELIATKTIDIKTTNDRLVKYTTINSYNNENKRNYTMLSEIDKELATIIDVLDTILVNFQSFRKELYDTFVLNKLVEKTNKIIKTLCHTNTKPFKLNYNVDISNDNVHIYWLIHNDNIATDSDKQYISVSQASGFQRFVISLALRMTLYFNNYDVLCNQLFIDEGFINFDKYNLSIVPSFLKSLLRYFNTIVILSHIDIIQDTIDETATINFNHMNSISSITYN
jgi:DNA repair exonuclease SbcCD ATPase subunit